MAKYVAEFYAEHNGACQFRVKHISLVKYRDNLVEFTTQPTPDPTEIVVVNMGKWAGFVLTEMED